VIVRNTSIIAVILVVSLGVSAGAQTLVQPELPPDARHQVDVFSDSLRAAIVNAGRQLAVRAQQVVPDIMLRFETDPAVFGTWMPRSEGVTFVVDVPAIEATSVQLFDVYRRLGPRNVGNGNGTSPVVNPVIPPDPVVPPMTDPVAEYSEFTRQALVDAMLQNAFALPLKDGQTLTVIVGQMETGRSTMITEMRKRLYLTISGEDLAALRQGRITRDEARKRIQERRY
jgi:hypothetical protein